jgi:hypothetical protein
MILRVVHAGDSVVGQAQEGDEQEESAPLLRAEDLGIVVDLRGDALAVIAAQVGRELPRAAE